MQWQEAGAPCMRASAVPQAQEAVLADRAEDSRSLGVVRNSVNNSRMASDHIDSTGGTIEKSNLAIPAHSHALCVVEGIQ